MVYTSLDQTRLDYKDPLHALNAAKKLLVTDKSKMEEKNKNKNDHYPIYRAPMELKIFKWPKIRVFVQ